MRRRFWGMARMVALVLAAAATSVGFAGAARAQDGSPTANGGFAPAPYAPGFGAPGSWVLSVSSANAASASLFLHKTSGGGSELNVHPALDAFIAPHVSVGAVVGIDYSSGGATTLDFGARAGFSIGIGGPVGFWPTAGIFVQHSSSSGQPSSTPASLGVFAPFLFHLVPHAFVGLGPSLNLGLNDGNGKELGIDYIIGGWL
jgi:hypothetical protein